MRHVGNLRLASIVLNLSNFICVKTLPYDEARKQAEIGMCCFEPELLHLRLNHSALMRLVSKLRLASIVST